MWVWTEFIWLSTRNQRRVLVNTVTVVVFHNERSGQVRSIPRRVELQLASYKRLSSVELGMLVRSECCAVVGLLLQQKRTKANQTSVVKMEATSYQFVRVNRRAFRNRVINYWNCLLKVERKNLTSTISRYGLQRHLCHWPTSLNTHAVTLWSFVKPGYYYNYAYHNLSLLWRVFTTIYPKQTIFLRL